MYAACFIFCKSVHKSLGTSFQSDARALRVVLSLTGVKEGLRGHVVVEMSDLDNEPLVKLVGGEVIETVVAHDVIGRLMIQCALQPGLAQVIKDALFRICSFIDVLPSLSTIKKCSIIVKIYWSHDFYSS